MTEYVLNHLSNCERNVDTLFRFCKQQGRFDKKMVIFSAITAASLYLIDKRLKKQREEINQLKDQIKELKGE